MRYGIYHSFFVSSLLVVHKNNKCWSFYSSTNLSSEYGVCLPEYGWPIEKDTLKYRKLLIDYELFDWK